MTKWFNMMMDDFENGMFSFLIRFSNVQIRFVFSRLDFQDEISVSLIELVGVDGLT